jgi:hypothetical protein
VTEVCLMSRTDKTGIIIPAHVIQIDEKNNNFVWVNKEGKARKRIIDCGEYTSDGVVVKEGIADGDEIIISGQQKVSDGSVITY